ncbi:hypothetical protein [Actinoplanes sp. NPDC049802]|uniref:hypothetical protein n=1 Tax=Actinoplanes sp. NPDC049802 TaxID=3154742 RepID=UPI00340B764D
MPLSPIGIRLNLVRWWASTAPVGWSVDAWSVAGGTQAWQRSGRPVVQGTRPGD